MRALALRCSTSAEEIKSLVSGTSEEVASGVALVSQSGNAFASITQAVAALTNAIEGIAASTEAQSESLSYINKVVGDIDRSTQQNAAMAEECTAAAASLAHEADTLANQVGSFEVDGAHIGYAGQPSAWHTPHASGRARGARAGGLSMVAS